jgi:hypothetical protein
VSSPPRRLSAFRGLTALFYNTAVYGDGKRIAETNLTGAT